MAVLQSPHKVPHNLENPLFAQKETKCCLILINEMFFFSPHQKGPKNPSMSFHRLTLPCHHCISVHGNQVSAADWGVLGGGNGTGLAFYFSLHSAAWLYHHQHHSEALLYLESMLAPLNNRMFLQHYSNFRMSKNIFTPPQRSSFLRPIKPHYFSSWNIPLNFIV